MYNKSFCFPEYPDKSSADDDRKVYHETSPANGAASTSTNINAHLRKSSRSSPEPNCGSFVSSLVVTSTVRDRSWSTCNNADNTWKEILHEKQSFDAT